MVWNDNKNTLTDRQRIVVDIVLRFCNNYDISNLIVKMAGLTFAKDYVGHKGTVSKIKLSKNNHYLFTACDSPSPCVRMWYAETGICCAEFQQSVDVIDFDISEKCELLVIGNEYGEISLYDVHNCKHIRKYIIGYTVLDLLLCDGDNFLVARGESEESAIIMHIYHVKSGQKIYDFKEEHYNVSATSPLRYKSSDNSLVYGTNSGDIYQTNLGDCKVPSKTFVGHSGSVTCLQFSSDERHLYSASTGGPNAVKKWDAETCVCLFTCMIAKDNCWISSLVLFDDVIITGTAGANTCYVYEWDANTGEMKGKLATGAKHVQYLEISQDGSYLLFSRDWKSVQAVNRSEVESEPETAISNSFYTGWETPCAMQIPTL